MENFEQQLQAIKTRMELAETIRNAPDGAYGILILAVPAGIEGATDMQFVNFDCDIAAAHWLASCFANWATSP